ncbi:hypothetical protein GCM10025866_13820 [Naasia aerilata]|uniref:XRE family transcriptional regulator n=1 Tax=Naasia aerilata TaxID=1162966 RepID=A0ABM8GB84_9MICO|nr:hypothetical protein GCM10025866_13820 [Naasia aerilata]
MSPSTISRMANDLKPDVEAFAAMTSWLRMPAENFYTASSSELVDEQPDLVAQLVPLLRARKDLTSKDIAYLEEVIAAAARRFQAGSDARRED